MDILHQSILAGMAAALAIWFLTHNIWLMVVGGSACGIIWLLSRMDD